MLREQVGSSGAVFPAGSRGWILDDKGAGMFAQGWAKAGAAGPDPTGCVILA